MTLGLDQKEDLRLRMLELEKKLAESEEERNKLEMTCNILTRAFREEEKMYYRELNKKYEKFLEDCTLRRKRNDIILKSLCRIEDRAKALFAKTERLKILKDRYISYLKINDFKKYERDLFLKNFPYSFSSQKNVHDEIPKSVHWKSPDISDIMLDHKAKEFVEPETKPFYKYGLTSESLNRENKEEIFENNFTPSRTLGHKEPEKNTVKYQNLWHKEFSENSISVYDNQENSEKTFENYKPQEKRIYTENANLNIQNKSVNINCTRTAQNSNLKKNFEITDRDVTYGRGLKNELEGKNIDDLIAKENKIAFEHQESIEKLKKALSVEAKDEIENDKKFENSGEIQKVIEKDEIEMNEKDVVKKNDLKPINEDLNGLAISKTDAGFFSECKNDAINLQSDEAEDNIQDTVPEYLPPGLDGIDYQNETYPESYYEQPVHHSHTSIASDVILEEDESEQDVDENEIKEEAKNILTRSSENEHDSYYSKNNIRETGQRSEPYPEKQLIESPDKAYYPHTETQKFSSLGDQFKVNAGSFDRDEKSQKSDVIFNSEKNSKRAAQSNLMQLLESDSESFQIEHGDMATGNEDSDFDFSFNQN